MDIGKRVSDMRKTKRGQTGQSGKASLTILVKSQKGILEGKNTSGRENSKCKGMAGGRVRGGNMRVETQGLVCGCCGKSSGCGRR